MKLCETDAPIIAASVSLPSICKCVSAWKGSQQRHDDWLSKTDEGHSHWHSRVSVQPEESAGDTANHCASYSWLHLERSQIIRGKGFIRSPCGLPSTTLRKTYSHWPLWASKKNFYFRNYYFFNSVQCYSLRRISMSSAVANDCAVPGVLEIPDQCVTKLDLTRRERARPRSKIPHAIVESTCTRLVGLESVGEGRHGFVLVVCTVVTNLTSRRRKKNFGD